MSTVLEVRKLIKSGKTAPLYLLEGDDLQSRHDLALEFAAVVEEGLHAFNVESLYANEASNAIPLRFMFPSLLEGRVLEEGFRHTSTNEFRDSLPRANQRSP